MPINRLSSHLAAHTGIRQVNALARADSAANAVERAILRQWRAFIEALPDSPSPEEARRLALLYLRPLYRIIRDTLYDQFDKIARWGHRATVKLTIQTLPLDYLRAVSPLPSETIKAYEHRLMEADPGLVQITPAGGEPLPTPLLTPDMSQAAEREAYRSVLFPPPSRAEVDRVTRDRRLSTIQAAGVLKSPQHIRTGERAPNLWRIGAEPCADSA